jgi:hypothetical protein
MSEDDPFSRPSESNGPIQIFLKSAESPQNHRRYIIPGGISGSSEGEDLRSLFALTGVQTHPDQRKILDVMTACVVCISQIRRRYG